MIVDEIYKLIAQNITLNIPHGDWTKALLFIQGDNTYVDTKGEYFLENNQMYPINVQNFDDEVDFALMELHEITTQDGNNRWNRATFNLNPDGKFNMEFIWDEELNNEIERLAKS